MPMTISHGSRTGEETIDANQVLKTFSGGQVWLDPVLNADDISIYNVNFAPCARTYWHHHEGGQFLHVLAGSGWICDKGGRPQKIIVGDVVWCPAGTTHWHGADDGSYMVHQAVSHGKIEWRDEVRDEEYKQKR